MTIGNIMGDQEFVEIGICARLLKTFVGYLIQIENLDRTLCRLIAFLKKNP